MTSRRAASALVACVAGIAALLAVAFPENLVRCIGDGRPSRVAVVGAGLAGLVAAVELAHKPGPSVDVIVVEAQAHAGGRVVSVPLCSATTAPATGSAEPGGADMPRSRSQARGAGGSGVHCAATAGCPCIETGATFIHGVEGNPLMRLVRHYGLQTVPVDYDRVYVMDGAERVPEKAVDQIKSGVYDEARKRFFAMRESDLANGRRDSTVETGFSRALASMARDRGLGNGTDLLAQLSPQEQRVLSWHFYWEIVQDQVAPLHKLSALSYDASLGFRGADHIFKNGVAGLIDALVADFLGTSEGEGGGLVVRGCRALHDLLASRPAGKPMRVLALSCPLDLVAGPEAAGAEGRHDERRSPSFFPDLQSPSDSGTADVSRGTRTWASHALRLVREWAATFSAHLRTPSAGTTPPLSVTLNGGLGELSLDVDAAVIAVPLAVLTGGGGGGGGGDDWDEFASPGRVHRLRFSPPLPRQKRRSASRLGCSPTLKFAVRFARRFWPSDAHFIGLLAAAAEAGASPPHFWAGDADHIEIFNMDHFRRNRVLVFEIEGAFAVRVGALAARTNATFAFVDVLGGRVKAAFGLASLAPLIEAVWANNYVFNPHIHCGFSYWTPGSDGDDNLDLRAALHGGALQFAAEHTTPDMYGNMHGAVAEGQRAANAMQEYLRVVAQERVLGWIGAARVAGWGCGVRGGRQQRRPPFNPAWCPQQCR